jgi:hypothetical protein
MTFCPPQKGAKSESFEDALTLQDYFILFKSAIERHLGVLDAEIPWRKELKAPRCGPTVHSNGLHKLQPCACAPGSDVRAVRAALLAHGARRAPTAH